MVKNGVSCNIFAFPGGVQKGVWQEEIVGPQRGFFVSLSVDEREEI